LQLHKRLILVLIPILSSLDPSNLGSLEAATFGLSRSDFA